MEMFDNKQDVEHIAISVDNNLIAKNNYDLSVGSYLKSKDNSVEIEISALNTLIS